MNITLKRSFVSCTLLDSRLFGKNLVIIDLVIIVSSIHAAVFKILMPFIIKNTLCNFSLD